MRSTWNKKKDGQEKLQIGFLAKNYKKLTKSSAAVILFASLTFNLGFAKETEAQDSISKIYHVYAGNQYVGAISDFEAVNTVLQAQENKAVSQYDQLEVEAGSNIKIISEQVFNTETNDAETLAKLEKAVVVEAEAYALLVDNKPVAFLKDQQDYEEAIRLLQLQFVTEEELNEWTKNQSSDTPLPELKTWEERIVEISIDKTISGAEDKVVPSKILAPEEAVQFLMTGAIEQASYEVQEGDVLGSIANKHGLTTSELLELNPSITEETLLQIGQKLNVTVAKPLVNVSVVKEKKVIEVIENAKIVKEDENMFKGEKVVKQEGSNGKKRAYYRIAENNGVRTDKTLLEEAVIEQPVNREVVVGTKVVSSRGTGDFAWPTIGGYISSVMGNRWGEYHRGIDIARPSSYAILAADNGVVVSTGYDGSYGNKVVIDHNNGYTTLYAHLSEINVSVGQVVPQGSNIGIMGSTGVSTGTHLHFEVEQGGSLVDPLSVLH